MKTKGLLTLSLVIIFSSCGKKNASENLSAESDTISIEASTISLREVDQLGTYKAVVEAEVTNNIAPQTSVRIKKVYAEVGDRVRAGQKLADMDAANLNQAKLKMENDKSEFDRVDRLYQVGGESKSNWDAKKLAYDLSKESYENMLENTSLVSPISGIVTQRNYDSGDMFSMGAPIYVVEQIHPVKIMVGVSESMYTKVKKGNEVDIQLDVFGNEIFKGTVHLVYPSIDRQTHTFQVEVRINNNDEKIRPGMFARVTFNYGMENRIVVADRAIQKQSGSGEKYVFVIKEGIAEYRKVELGQRLDDEYEVISGLDSGETIAVTGQSRLSTGTRVKIVNI